MSGEQETPIPQHILDLLNGITLDPDAVTPPPTIDSAKAQVLYHLRCANAYFNGGNSALKSAINLAMDSNQDQLAAQLLLMHHALERNTAVIEHSLHDFGFCTNDTLMLLFDTTKIDHSMPLADRAVKLIEACQQQGLEPISVASPADAFTSKTE